MALLSALNAWYDRGVTMAVVGYTDELADESRRGHPRIGVPGPAHA
jgi:hypothetical protein